MKQNDIQKARYFAEYALLMSVMAFFGLMSPDMASRVAGKLGRKIGPYLPSSKTALANLKMALPRKSDDDYKDIIAGMWENLARVVAEYPHLELFAPDVQFNGIDHLKTALQDYDQVILFSGHLANWEMMAASLLNYGLATDLVYRAPNNPRIDRALNNYRSLGGKLRTLPKSKAGTRKLVESLKEGRSVGILIDQKYNEGIEVPFMGHPAMTSTAFVELAQKFDCALVPFRVERAETTRFIISFYPPMTIFDDRNANELTPIPAADVIAQAHDLLAGWIAEKPHEWLWIHNRWVRPK